MSKLLKAMIFYVIIILIFAHLMVYAHQTHDPTITVTLSPNFSSDNTLFVIRDEIFTLYKSVDRGKTYYPPTDPLTNKDLTTIAFSTDFSVDKSVFAGTQTEGFFKSIDEGDTWTQLNNGLDDLFITSIDVSPDFAANKTKGVCT